MTLQDDLNAKALSLISQQMANWVVDIQRQIGEHQGNIVRALDDLQESVARYDEKFGHIFIISASGKSAEEMLLALLQRLENSPEEELPVAAEEQRKITRLRLTKFFLTR